MAQAALRLRKLFPDSTKFLTAYAPSLQPGCASVPARCYLGSAPTLRTVAGAYGRATAEAWLEIQLNDLARFAGASVKLNAMQSEETARVILAGWPWLNVAELSLFFFRFKAGRYGHFYGAVDPLVITSALREFARQRVGEITAYEMERNAAERLKPRTGWVTRQAYDEHLAWLALYGDEQAQQLLQDSQATQRLLGL